MPSLDNLTPNKKFLGLFVGESGSGKKAAAASFPKPILFLDFDLRIRGLLGCPWIDMKGLGEVESFTAKNKTGEFSFQKVNDFLEQLQAKTNVGMNPFQTLYVGSITGAAFAFLNDAITLTHQDGRGMKLGPMNMSASPDYKFESNGIKQFIAFLQWLFLHPTGISNIIVGGHVIPKWGKPGMEKEDLTEEDIKEIKKKYQYDDNIVVGEKMSLTDKLASDVPSKFDHIFKFHKEMVIGRPEPQHFVTFRDGLARTSFAKLPNGKVNITGKAFYSGLMKMAGFEE